MFPIKFSGVSFFGGYDDDSHLSHFSFHCNDSFQLSYQYEITTTPMISCKQPWAHPQCHPHPPVILALLRPLDVHKTLYFPYLGVPRSTWVITPTYPIYMWNNPLILTIDLIYSILTLCGSFNPFIYHPLIRSLLSRDILVALLQQGTSTPLRSIGLGLSNAAMGGGLAFGNTHWCGKAGFSWGGSEGLQSFLGKIKIYIVSKDAWDIWLLCVYVC